MKVRNVFGLMLSVVLLLLLAGSSLAGESQPAGPSEAVGVNASPAANAPWFNITVDAYDVGQYTSVAIDPVNNTTYISYYDETYKDLRMAKYVGSGGNCGPNNDWSCETVDSAGDVGKYSSIAINPVMQRVRVRIAYYDATNGALKLAYKSGLGWIIKTIHDPLLGAGSYASLKIDSTGKTHIAYYFKQFFGNSLFYAEYVGGGAGNCTDNDYQCDSIDSGDQVGKYASLALDSSDRPRIAYNDGGNNALWYAFHDGVKWNHLKILPANSGQYASLYVDNGDISHIAHYDSSNGKLGYAVWVGSGGNCGLDMPSMKYLFQCYDIESVGTITHPKGLSLAVDAAGRPIIAYQKVGSLKVARPAAALGLLIGNCGPSTPFYTWYCETIDPFQSLGPVSNGDFVSIALNSSGLATIAYYQEFSASFIGILKVAYQQFQGFLPLVMKNQ